MSKCFFCNADKVSHRSEIGKETIESCGSCFPKYRTEIEAYQLVAEQVKDFDPLPVMDEDWGFILLAGKGSKNLGFQLRRIKVTNTDGRYLFENLRPHLFEIWPYQIIKNTVILSEAIFSSAASAKSGKTDSIPMR